MREFYDKKETTLKNEDPIIETTGNEENVDMQQIDNTQQGADFMRKFLNKRNSLQKKFTFRNCKANSRK